MYLPFLIQTGFGTLDLDNSECGRNKHLPAPSTSGSGGPTSFPSPRQLGGASGLVLAAGLSVGALQIPAGTSTAEPARDATDLSFQAKVAEEAKCATWCRSKVVKFWSAWIQSNCMQQSSHGPIGDRNYKWEKKTFCVLSYIVCWLTNWDNIQYTLVFI